LRGEAELEARVRAAHELLDRQMQVSIAVHGGSLQKDVAIRKDR
jgi:hypothetical protein